MAIQIIDVKTGAELKLVKQNGFFRLHEKVYVGDLYSGESEGSEFLIITREVPITDIGAATTLGQEQPHP